MRKGFTLSETLITLGIIGVVATLTLPNLTASYRKRIVETKLQRIYKVMNDAIELSTVYNGETADWPQFGESDAPTGTADTILAFYNQYLGPYIKGVKRVEVGQNGEGTQTGYIYLHFDDDSTLIIPPYLYDMSYYTSTKKFKAGTTVAGVDAFNFRFSPKYVDGSEQSTRGDMTHIVDSRFNTYAYAWDGTIEGAKNSTINSWFSCYNPDGGRSLCAKLIQLNGWKIPDDYPYRF